MSAFEWKDWGSGRLPELERHSEAKLSVLRNYVTDYICILCSDSYGRDAFRITLVDGFAGGGAYRGSKLGSPFVFLESVAAADAKINTNRQKPLLIDCHYYFVEEDREAFECLKAQLEHSIYKDQIGKTIFLKHGSFHQCQTLIVAETKARFTRGGSRGLLPID